MQITSSIAAALALHVMVAFATYGEAESRTMGPTGVIPIPTGVYTSPSEGVGVKFGALERRDPSDTEIYVNPANRIGGVPINVESDNNVHLDKTELLARSGNPRVFRPRGVGRRARE
ncbi:uncharacterized protein HMPREF1541_01564 [Cyphellophora europaea CBS 101466]|uniref:Uncharacterized protein n=1 Tax=Cyphellophora europaea (strain CBS 101466) TaxID=1220924 RepID=W2S1G2_CYPE1|nr:uncharacterized protein HMPREF1541_01564 [Cyphellophora europaea CBS 101466]ETN42410.1 hypothetical protein HMPREF1541_01564 [Cyphellophora europaea CBS 101466]